MSSYWTHPIALTFWVSFCYNPPRKIEALTKNQGYAEGAETMETAVLNEEVVKEAFDLIRPSVVKYLMSPKAGRAYLHMVVLDPETGYLLHEETFGEDDRSNWEHPYDEYALSKAQICWRTGMVTRDVKKDAPWLYRMGDTRYVGGYVKNGLAVAASALHDHIDEMFSRMAWTAIQGICRDVIAVPPNPNADWFE